MCGNQDYTLMFATNGMYTYEGKAIPGMNIMWNAYDGYFNIMVPANSDINSIQDLQGKRVNVGSPTASATLMARYIFETLGIDIYDFCTVTEMSASEAAEALQEGTIDAMISGAGLGASVGVELASSRVGMKLVSFSDDEIKTVTEKTLFVEGTIPADTYPGVPECHTFKNSTVIACLADLPEDVVYECVKQINEHVDELAQVIAVGADSTAENTALAWGDQDLMTVHPGTMKYLKELGLAK